MSGKRAPRIPLPEVLVGQFRSRLRQERLARKMTLDEVAALVGVARTSVGDWERGVCLPTPDHAVRWALAVGVKLSFEAIVTPLNEYVPSAITTQSVPRVTIRRREDEV